MSKQARHGEEEPQQGHSFEVDCSHGLGNLVALVAARSHKMDPKVDAPLSGDFLRDALVP